MKMFMTSSQWSYDILFLSGETVWFGELNVRSQSAVMYKICERKCSYDNYIGAFKSMILHD